VFLNLYDDGTPIELVLFDIKMAFGFVFSALFESARECLNRFADLVKTCLEVKYLLFGPMLAVLFRRHPIFPSKLAIEIGEVGKATVVRHLRNGLVSLP